VAVGSSTSDRAWLRSRCRPAARTAAAAVVFAPLESSISDTLIPYCGIRCFFTSASTASPAATSEPPTKIAVLCRSFDPRVKMHPWTSGITFCGVTPP